MFASLIQTSLILLTLAAGAFAAGAERGHSPADAETRAVDYLKREVPAWSRENGCFSCHNNGDGARALYTAARKGYRLPPEVLADTTAWVTQPGHWDENKGEPGFNDKRLANVQFAASLVAALEASQTKDRGALREAARKVAADQAADGSWPIEPGNVVGSPATYGTTLATYMAVRTLEKARVADHDAAIRKGLTWLRQTRPTNVMSAATLLLVSGLHSGTPDHRNDECLELIRGAQTRDGGWGPYFDSPPEPFDTAAVLLAMAELREGAALGEMIARGRKFLAAQQNADGSWPATTRPAGGDSYAQKISTTAWAALALLATRE